MRYVLLASVLLLGACWAGAQNSASKPSPSSAGTHTTVEGCLSSSNGNFTLTDKNGSAYQLTGDTTKLSDHVGHEIKVTGVESSGSSASSGGTMGQTNTGSQPTIEISSFRHISKTCQSSGMSH